MPDSIGLILTRRGSQRVVLAEIYGYAKSGAIRTEDIEVVIRPTGLGKSSAHNQWDQPGPILLQIISI